MLERKSQQNNKEARLLQLQTSKACTFKTWAKPQHDTKSSNAFPILERTATPKQRRTETFSDCSDPRPFIWRFRKPSRERGREEWTSEAFYNYIDWKIERLKVCMFKTWEKLHHSIKLGSRFGIADTKSRIFPEHSQIPRIRQLKGSHLFRITNHRRLAMEHASFHHTLWRFGEIPRRNTNHHA